MSPASQGNLEVERYIGSCLISTRVRNNNSVQGGHKGKKPSDGSRGKLSSHPRQLLGPRGCSDQFGHVSTGGYIPFCDCGGFKFGRYGPSGRHSGAGWAGMPLISMAPHLRRNRKSTSHTNPNGNRNPRNIPSTQDCNTPNIVGGTDSNPCAQERTPLSRLAIHTQGVPLILSGRYNTGGRKAGSTNRNVVSARQLKVCDEGSKKYPLGGNEAAGNSSSTPSSDNLSVTSDESSGQSENCLPRIIKPRKRRKKDRKPPSVSSVKSVSPQTGISDVSNTPNIVTLKPYIPLCYELYGGNGPWHAANRWFSLAANVNSPVDILKHLPPDKNECAPVTPFFDTAVEDHISDDDNHDPKLHHNFDDVEEDTTTSSVSYPCIPSVCQCRYCDPSGLIWDVDQHSYSPFLTRPSMVDSDDRFFGSALSFLSPVSESRTSDFYSKSLCSSPSFESKENNSAVLRRSWSDPLTSRSAGNIFASENGSAEIRKTCSDAGETTQSLEVSTEIVTSPNGHRDIEIKFYSSLNTAPSSPPHRSNRYLSDIRRLRTSASSSSDGDSGVDIWKNAGDNDACDGVFLSGSSSAGDGEFSCDTRLGERYFSTKSLRDEVNRICLRAEE